MHVLMCIVASVVIFWYAFYYNKACKNLDRYNDPDKGVDLYIAEISGPVSKLVWIEFAILSIIFFTVGCIMLNRLRLYYRGFFEEFGR